MTPPAKPALWRTLCRYFAVVISLILSYPAGYFLGRQIWPPTFPHYINENKARDIAYRTARYDCARHGRHDCRRFKITRMKEHAQGWWMEIASTDRRRFQILWIDRVGDIHKDKSYDLDKGDPHAQMTPPTSWPLCDAPWPASLAPCPAE